jgi:chaperonin GroES
MVLNLTRGFVEVQEVGFPPKAMLFGGLLSPFIPHEETRNRISKFRLGVVTAVSLESDGVVVGDFVCFSQMQSSPGLGKDLRVVFHKDLMGSYKGVILSNNAYSLDMEKFSFKPLSDRLVVKEVVQDQKVGGLIMPEKINSTIYYRKGEVVEVGDEVKDLKVGQQVIFGKQSGMPLDLVEGSFLLMREAEIYGYYQEEI